MRPRLLVSVRNVEEARLALSGGADIIDIKEPKHGPLGAADPGVIQGVCESVRMVNSSVQLSAAMGEVAEEQTARPAFSGQAGPGYLKSGLATLASGDWKNTWRNSRERISRIYPAASWVAVAYADSERAGAPPVREVIDEAAASGIGTLLIDTFTKDDTGLTHWISSCELRELRTVTCKLGLKLALAGQVTGAVLPQILSAGQPDIIAVRGAVCEGGSRGASVDTARVAELKQQLSTTAPAASMQLHATPQL